MNIATGDWFEVRSPQSGELLARVLVSGLPEIATITRAVSRRGGKVYVDYLQIGAGRLIVAPFSARPLPSASGDLAHIVIEVSQCLDADLADRARIACRRGPGRFGE